MWYNGKLWKRRETTKLADLNGELAHEEDWGWFLEHGFEVRALNPPILKSNLSF